jgi:hypothetical protein
MPKLYRYINKKRHPFSGKIKTFKDVNDFIINKDIMFFQDKDENGNICKYTIVNTKTYTTIYDVSYKGGSKIIYIIAGVYKSEIGDNYWYYMYNRISIPTRAFVWKHKDAINEQLEKERELKEKDARNDVKDKERILELKQLDKNIRKDIFRIIRGDNNMQNKTIENSFLASLKNDIKMGFVQLLEYVKLLVIAIFLSYLVGFILLFLYATEYGAPFPVDNNLLTDFAKLFLILFGIGVIFSVGPENLFKFILSLIAGITVIIMLLGLFAKWRYSPQRDILNLYNKGGKTVSYRIKKDCSGINLPNKAFLIYKGKYMNYFKVNSQVVGINKDCFFY